MRHHSKTIWEAADAARRLLNHATTHGALFHGGKGPEPSAGLYYWFQGKRRSFWSLYLSEDRPSVTLNLGSIFPRDRQLAYRMVAQVRQSPALDAALLHDDNIIVRRYPTIDLATLAESPDALDALIGALDLAVTARVLAGPSSSAPGAG